MEADQPQHLKHRDLNWLSFNMRVLQEAEDREHNPLFERMKFLAIYSSNLDEYFRVRVSQLRQMKRIEKSIRKKLSLHPSKTVKKILAEIKKQQEVFGSIFKNEIIPDLAANNMDSLIRILKPSGVITAQVGSQDKKPEQVEKWLDVFNKNFGNTTLDRVYIPSFDCSWNFSSSINH